MSQNIPILVGSVALLSTTIVEVFTIICAAIVSDPSIPVRKTAIVASFFGPFNIASVACLLISSVQKRRYNEMAKPQPRWIPMLSSALCVISGVISLATFVLLQDRVDSIAPRLSGIAVQPLLTGAFITGCTAILSQGIQLTSVFVLMNGEKSRAQSVHINTPMTTSKETYEPEHPVPAIRRSSATAASQQVVQRSNSDAPSSLRSSMSQRIRPITSKTRLLVSRASSRRSCYSYESSLAGTAPVTDDGFDSWDTSAVDPESRTTIPTTFPPLQMPAATHPNALATIPASPYLETIPDSPAPSRNGSPSSDFLPPVMAAARRSRSFSSSSARSQRRQNASSPTSSEAHIHPLFRSDSPFEVPAITSTTIITAAPGAGRILTDRKSIADLTQGRMRSSSASILSSPPSSLRASRSVEGFPWHLSAESIQSASLSTSNLMAMATPTASLLSPRGSLEKPIPDFILGADARNSLTGYQIRKMNGGMDVV